MAPKERKRGKISCFEELKVLSEGLEVCPGAEDPSRHAGGLEHFFIFKNLIISIFCSF
jgi:hypothetical protein